MATATASMPGTRDGLAQDSGLRAPGFGLNVKNHLLYQPRPLAGLYGLSLLS